jgi:hypothetical protein
MKRLATAFLLVLASQAAMADDARFEACKAKLKKANELDLLYAFDWKPPAAPHVLVGPTFFKIPIDAKEGFAETLNCFLMAGDEGQCVNFPLKHWQTGKAVAEFKNCRLKMN